MKSKLTCFFALLLASLTPLDAAPGPARKPSIVFILSDDIGYGDVGCYGATNVKTPNIDKLAAEGIRFTDAYATSAMCTPTRYATLTGEYPWRGAIRRGVLNGDAGLIIKLGAVTWPALMKKAGYVTGAIGKWHLGLGPKETGPNYNGDLNPGPLEVGFDYFFGYPATNDRVPTVYVENHRVVGLDPNDPIHVTPGGGGKSSWAAGRQRIGRATGGKSAWWKDNEMATVLEGKVVEFLEAHQGEPFFLYYTPRNIHPPLTPGKRFISTSETGVRGDDIQELDWVVGDVMATLERLKIADNSLVIFTSDNGGSHQDSPGHRVNGALRGYKMSIYEGGTRVPFILRWPAQVKPGATSKQLVSLVDMTASFAALVGQEAMAKARPDSVNVLPALLDGALQEPVRKTLVIDDARSDLAIRDNEWKLIPGQTNELYNLKTDFGETHNVAAEHPAIVGRLQAELEKVRKQLADSALTHPGGRTPRKHLHTNDGEQHEE